MTNIFRDITLRTYKIEDVLDWYCAETIKWLLENEDDKYQEAYNRRKRKELYRQQARDLIN